MEFVKNKIDISMIEFLKAAPLVDPVQQAIESAFKAIQQKRLDQIKERLAMIGFTFRNPMEFEEFARGRLTCSRYEDRPSYIDLYLDYGKKSEILIASWWDTYEIDRSNLSAEYSYHFTVYSGYKPKC